MLLDAVVFAINADSPKATFSPPVVFADKELLPTAVLLDAVVFVVNAR